MTEKITGQMSDILADTKGMIDGLKTVCADAGLANDSSEYKIITEAFLYKFLNDKFLYELGQLDCFQDVGNIEKAYCDMDTEERELVCMELSPNTAFISSDYLISSLFGVENTSDFHTKFDVALKGIAADNMDIFSVKTGEGQAITLFSGVSQYILDDSKKSPFCKALINKLANFSFERAFGQKYDFFSAVFEYLISDYNKDSGTYGEYFTPHSIASIIARILVPDDVQDVTVYDPAAGSGTLVLAIAHEIGEDNCTIYTQDRSQKANEFMRLNLILNNLVHSLPNVVHDDTLVSPRHLEANKKSIKRFDYIVSNPPFKCDFSATRDELAGEAHSKRFWAGVPKVPAKKKESMAIYLMFLQHILYSLADDGKAAIVVPTGFLTAKSGIEKKIRQAMVEGDATKGWPAGMLRGVVSMPSNIFANTGTNVSIIFLDKAGAEEGAILIDASKLGTKVKLDGKNQKTVLSADEIKQIVGTFRKREEVDDFSVVTSFDAIREKGYSFSAGQYFEVKIDYVDITAEEFAAKMAAFEESLAAKFAEGRRLEDEILKQIGGLKYED